MPLAFQRSHPGEMGENSPAFQQRWAIVKGPMVINRKTLVARQFVPVHGDGIFQEIRRNNRETLVQSRVAASRLKPAFFTVPLPAPAASKPADPVQVPVVESAPAVPPSPASRSKVEFV